MMRYFLVLVGACVFILCAFILTVCLAATLSPQSKIATLEARVRLLEQRLADKPKPKPSCTLPDVEHYMAVPSLAATTRQAGLAPASPRPRGPVLVDYERK